MIDHNYDVNRMKLTVSREIQHMVLLYQVDLMTEDLKELRTFDMCLRSLFSIKKGFCGYFLILQK